ncbi:MAG: YtxH domain-containing protein [Bacteroidetes bacterium]|nr:YtxH domain-containing protein [Bacteroidota bacterium]
MKDRSTGRTFSAGTWGAILGGIVGFGLGLLLAPEEGRRLRRKLAYQLDHLSEQVADLIEKTLSPESESEARRDGKALVDDAQEKAEKIRTDIDTLLGEMREGQETP